MPPSIDDRINKLEAEVAQQKSAAPAPQRAAPATVTPPSATESVAPHDKSTPVYKK
jgi:hypothetical protein